MSDGFYRGLEQLSSDQHENASPREKIFASHRQEKNIFYLSSKLALPSLLAKYIIMVAQLQLVDSRRGFLPD